jgi:hypothetical protein
MKEAQIGGLCHKHLVESLKSNGCYARPGQIIEHPSGTRRMYNGRQFRSLCIKEDCNRDVKFGGYCYLHYNEADVLSGSKTHGQRNFRFLNVLRTFIDKSRVNNDLNSGYVPDNSDNQKLSGLRADLQNNQQVIPDSIQQVDDIMNKHYTIDSITDPKYKDVEELIQVLDPRSAKYGISYEPRFVEMKLNGFVGLEEGEKNFLDSEENFNLLLDT